VRPRQLITNNARRNGVDDGLGTNVNFLHVDCLSSEVRLNVDLEVTLSVIAGPPTDIAIIRGRKDCSLPANEYHSPCSELLTYTSVTLECALRRCRQ
jgi:hypothetical protein